MGDSLPYVNLGSGRTAKNIFAGHFFSCAILDNDAVKCWGQNNFGQLGIGSTNNMGSASNQMGDNLPAVNLGTQSTVVSLALGYFHSCALFANGGVKCWGRSNIGQVGLETNQTYGTTSASMGDGLAFVNLGTGRTAKELAAGVYHTCALLDNDGVKCWGKNSDGQLGIGSTANRGGSSSQMGDDLPFVNFGQSLKAVRLSANYDSTCAVLEDGSVKCWGPNSFGELGVGNTLTIGTSPAQLGSAWPSTSLGVQMGSPEISAGRNFFCALGLENRVKCWGSSLSGSLGNGSTTQHLGDAAEEIGDSLPFLDL
jgi:alpha-tubulin suppressor-like RCC1 family protein